MNKHQCLLTSSALAFSLAGTTATKAQDGHSLNIKQGADQLLAAKSKERRVADTNCPGCASCVTCPNGGCSAYCVGKQWICEPSGCHPCSAPGLKGKKARGVKSRVGTMKY